MGPPVSVTYVNVRQESDSWCWAAVAANVYNSLLPPAEVKLKQCDVAQKVNQRCQPCSSRRPFSLGVALDSWKPKGQPRRGLGILQATYPTVDPSLFTDISGELTGTGTSPGQPVCAEVDFGSLAHFVAITGLDPVTHNVWVADPFPGGGSVEFTLDAFLHNYYFSNLTGGTVQAVYAVQPTAGEGEGAAATYTVTVAGGVPHISPDPTQAVLADGDYVIFSRTPGAATNVDVRVVGGDADGEIVIAVKGRGRWTVNPEAQSANGRVLIQFVREGDEDEPFPP